MPVPDVPDEIHELGEARRVARSRREFAEADRLRAQIEAAGWKVEDAGAGYRLMPARPPDVVDGDRVRYGASDAVPSRLSESAVGVASIVVVAADEPDALERLMASLAGAVEDDVQRIVVANAPAAEVETLLLAWEARSAAEAAGGAGGRAAVAEVVWTATRFGAAAALNAGIRRAASDVVLLLDPSVEAIGDIVTPLVRALHDPTVAVAGPWGLLSDDQRHFEPAEGAAGADGAEVAAIDRACMAFRRADYVWRGPLDERFASPVLLDAWWSLVLRDEEAGADDAGHDAAGSEDAEGEAGAGTDNDGGGGGAGRDGADSDRADRDGAVAGADRNGTDREDTHREDMGRDDTGRDGPDLPARRALVVDVPVVRRGIRTASDSDDAAERRNRYRLIDRFGNRDDLAVPLPDAND